MTVLDRFRPVQLRHPSWRVYRAIELVKEYDPALFPADVYQEILEDADPKTFGLKPDISVYYPYVNDDDLVMELVAAMTDPKYSDGAYCLSDCLNLFLNIPNRQLIEGMLLSGELYEDISSDLGYRLSFVQVYAQVFFDTSVWRSDADKLHYVYRGTVGKDAEIKQLVMEKGIEYVMSKKFHLPMKIKMEKALANLFGLTYTKSMDFLQNDTFEDQKCAQEWTKRTLDIYKELKSATAKEGGVKELRIALETSKAPVKSIEELE